MDKLIIGIKREIKRCFVDGVVTMSTHKPYAYTISSKTSVKIEIL